MVGKKLDWKNLALVLLGLLVVLVAPGMPLNSVLGVHAYEHYLLGVLVLALGLWNWLGKK